MSISGTFCIAANILKDALCDILRCVNGDTVKQFWLVQSAIKKVDKSVTKYSIFSRRYTLPPHLTVFCLDRTETTHKWICSGKNYANLRFLFDPKDQTLSHHPEANERAKRRCRSHRDSNRLTRSVPSSVPSSFGHDSWLAVGGIGHALCSVVHVWDQSRPV